MPKFFTKTPTSTQRTFLRDHDLNDDPLRTLLNWNAPSRPFRKKDRSFYTTVIIIAVLVMLISLLAQEFLLIGVVFALCFVVYVLGFVQPEETEYKISTQGITIGDHFYFWDDLDSFWVSQKDEQQIVHVLTHLRFPGMLMLLIGSQNEEQLKRVIAKYLPFREIAPKSLIEKWGEGLQKHFPLENPHR